MLLVLHIRLCLMFTTVHTGRHASMPRLAWLWTRLYHAGQDVEFAVMTLSNSPEAGIAHLQRFCLYDVWHSLPT